MIINLTQHVATPAQQEAGVIDLPEEERAELRELLTFGDLPTQEQIAERAAALADLAAMAGDGAVVGLGDAAMIGGAPYLMAPLERALRARGVTPLYAFSRRESAETTLPDGSIRKVQVFVHLGFVAVAADGRATALRELPWHQLLDCIEGPAGGEGPDTTHPAVQAEISRRIAQGDDPDPDPGARPPLNNQPERSLR